MDLCRLTSRILKTEAPRRAALVRKALVLLSWGSRPARDCSPKVVHVDDWLATPRELCWSGRGGLKSIASAALALPPHLRTKPWQLYIESRDEPTNPSFD
jgi:hypothetical protein